MSFYETTQRERDRWTVLIDFDGYLNAERPYRATLHHRGGDGLPEGEPVIDLDAKTLQDALYWMFQYSLDPAAVEVMEEHLHGD